MPRRGPSATFRRWRAAPAVADPAETFSASATFEDVNPYTGNLQEVHAEFGVQYHSHARNEVYLQGHHLTSDGYQSSEKD